MENLAKETVRHPWIWSLPWPKEMDRDDLVSGPSILPSPSFSDTLLCGIHYHNGVCFSDNSDFQSHTDWGPRARSQMLFLASFMLLKRRLGHEQRPFFPPPVFSSGALSSGRWNRKYLKPSRIIPPWRGAQLVVSLFLRPWGCLWYSGATLLKLPVIRGSIALHGHSRFSEVAVPPVQAQFHRAWWVWQEIRAALKRTAVRNQRLAGRHRLPAPKYQVSHQVWLSPSGGFMQAGLMVHQTLPYKPQCHLFEAASSSSGPSAFPCIIVQVVESHLHPSADSPPPVLIIDGQPVYTVSEILDVHRWGQACQYLVDWEGYSPEECSWIQKSLILDPGLLMDFYDRHPDKPGRMPDGVHWNGVLLWFGFCWCRFVFVLPLCLVCLDFFSPPTVANSQPEEMSTAEFKMQKVVHII